MSIGYTTPKPHLIMLLYLLVRTLKSRQNPFFVQTNKIAVWDDRPILAAFDSYLSNVYPRLFLFLFTLARKLSS